MHPTRGEVSTHIHLTGEEMSSSTVADQQPFELIEAQKAELDLSFFNKDANWGNSKEITYRQFFEG